MMVTKINQLASFLFLACLLSCTQYRPGSGLTGKTSEEVDPGIPFSVGRKAVQLLPYPMRLSKLRNVVGSSDAALYNEIESRKNELGGFDYANGVRQELSWLETRMTAWTKGLQPICSSEHMRSRFSWTGGLRDFVVIAYGREPSGQDLELISRVDALSATSNEKFEVYCLSILSSLEFLTL